MNSIRLQTDPSSMPLRLNQLAMKQSSRASEKEPDALKGAFQDFVGETFFQMMLKSMRTMHDKPAYMHGGQAEEIFQGQLDQQMASDLAQNSGAVFADDLYDLFALQLKHPASRPNSFAPSALSTSTND